MLSVELSKAGEHQEAPVSRITGSSQQKASVLLIGFEPFRGRVRNGSASLVRALSHDLTSTFNVEALTLPVVWGAIEDIVLPKLRGSEYQLVVGFGEGQPGVVAFERMARNARAGADVHGAQPRNEWVEMDGPERLASRLSFRFPRPKGLPLQLVVNDDPGDYLCNNLCYRLLDSTVAKAGFVHVPPEDSFRASSDYVSCLLPLARAVITHNLKEAGFEVQAQSANAW